MATGDIPFKQESAGKYANKSLPADSEAFIQALQIGLLPSGGLLTLDTIPDLKTLVGADYSGLAVSVLGYYAKGDGGGGLFYFDAAGADADNAGTIIAPNDGNGRWLRSYSGPVNVRWFGAKGDGSTDDTSAFQKAITYAVVNQVGIYIPAGVYRLTSTVTGPRSGYFPTVKTDGPLTTQINFSDIPAGQSCFEILGQSGGLLNGHWAGCYMIGGGDNTAFLVDGLGGYQFRDIVFYDCEKAIHLHSRVPGAFTEYVQAVNCTFTELCGQAMRYSYSGGADASFHGSGLVNCTMQEHVGATLCKIEIDAGAVVYNAPLSFQLWKNNNLGAVKNNSTASNSFHGCVTVEAFVGSGYLSDPSGVNGICFAGEVMFFNAQGISNFMLGTTWARSVTCNQDGTQSLTGIYFRTNTSLAPGDSSLGPMGVDGGQRYWIEINVDGPNYVYRCLLDAFNSGYNNAQTYGTIVDESLIVDSGGLGLPTISIDSVTGYLHISNAGFTSSFSARVTGNQISSRGNQQVI